MMTFNFTSTARYLYYILLGVLTLFVNYQCTVASDQNLLPADAPLSTTIDGIAYHSGNWAHPDYSEPFTSLGNHRLVIESSSDTGAVFVHLDWRRRDMQPGDKRMILINALTQDTVRNMMTLEVNNDFGNIIFEPQVGSSVYYLYYLPHTSTGKYYPKLTYLPPVQTADPVWAERVATINRMELPSGKVTAAESIDDFHSFFPMEVIATRDEVEAFTTAHPQSYYLFPESRHRSIRMSHFLPYHWMERGMVKGLVDQVKRGEYYTFQVGLYSPTYAMNNIDVSLTSLTGNDGAMIEADRLTCFNTGGIDLNGKSFAKSVSVPAGQVQAFWFGIDIPVDCQPGTYQGSFIFHPESEKPDTCLLSLQIAADTIANHGDDDPANMTRLRWLNSTLGTDPDFVVQPFLPVTYEDNTLHVLGRDILLGSNGLPEQITTHFTEEVTDLTETPQAILAKPVNLVVTNADGRQPDWESQPYTIQQDHPSAATWSTVNETDAFQMTTRGRLEYDGMLDYHLVLVARKDVDVKDIALPVAYRPEAAEYLVGLGYKGERRPERVDWHWDVEYHQEGVWMGAVNKGLQYVLRDENYERPLNTNFYHNKPLNMPPSWFNDGQGGIRITRQGEAIVADNYSGKRTIHAGDTLHFNIRFLITPFKPINTEKHLSTRFVHEYVPVDSAIAWGGTVINVHHAKPINPYINYPFFALDSMKAYIDEAHSKGVKVKLYNTIRELTYHAYEFFALRSLGDEIFNDGDGGGHSWLQEHLEDHYHSAWHATEVNDAAILDKGTSRWTNYYIEGLNWLAKNQEIDGLYLDDIAFSRETVKRIASVMNRHRDEVVIDLHSANQYNPRDGYINSVFLYMEHIPYISRLWFGEYFNYNEAPDYWITEVSGIPFGVGGEMLEKGGHPFRGLVYGMTTRKYSTFDPRPVWKLFDDFGIAQSRMEGYWVENNPVKTSNPRVRITIYRKPDQVLIAIGSWSQTNEKVRLDINWQTLGMDPQKVTLTAPAIAGLQDATTWSVHEPVLVPANEGIVLELRSK